MCGTIQGARLSGRSGGGGGGLFKLAMNNVIMIISNNYKVKMAEIRNVSPICGISIHRVRLRNIGFNCTDVG